MHPTFWIDIGWLGRRKLVGIIDFMRQYDILKQMERVGKSLPMVVPRQKTKKLKSYLL
jgi:hypothetical protein